LGLNWLPSGLDIHDHSEEIGLAERRVDGIEASADPLFEPRANVYLMSGRRRRAAGEGP
jgi:hypothetical protein